jgi:hypothetical protein
VAERVSQIPRQREVRKILEIEYVHRTRQLCGSEPKLMTLSYKRGRKCELKKHG